MNYTFSTLNDKEFEQIVRDLLNAKFNFELQSFKVGKDKGIDLRFSTTKNNNSLIVQAKHYANSSFAQLKHVLKEKELSKIKALKPDRYIVVTSLPLSATEKDELKNILSPYVLTSNDIIGQEDLNSYLAEHKEIESRYFKLWFSSTNVLTALLNNAIEGRTKYLLEEVRNKIPLFVVTKKIDEAYKILQKEKILLITGQPGIGKTTLSEILLFDLAREGYKIYKVENIKEAEDVISPENTEKQVFYFDDFLGANYYEIINAYRTETQLTAFVERIRKTPNKYFILTTRTVILNFALEKYEKISRSKLAEKQFELKLTDYNKYEKALILYNHLYFRQIDEKFFDCILMDKFYKKIIEHDNYTPRIIEFITDKTKFEKFDKEEYRQFIINNLNNPKEIWSYSFNNQISYFERCLITTLFTFVDRISEENLFEAFGNRLQYEKNEHNQVIKTNQFSDSIKILQNGFIVSYLDEDNKIPIRSFSFINPSLTDFLLGYISDSFSERKSIISSLKYYIQLPRFAHEKTNIPLEKELQLIIREKIANNNLYFTEKQNKQYSENKKYVIILYSLCRYCNQTNIDKLLFENFKKINFNDNGYAHYQLLYVLNNIGDSPETIEFIKNNFIKIIESLMKLTYDVDDAKIIPILFDKYSQLYTEYYESDEGFDNLTNTITNVLKEYEEESIRNQKFQVTDMSDVEFIYDEISSLERELQNKLFPTLYVSNDYGISLDEDFWESQIKENIQMSDIENDINFEHYKESIYEINSEEEDIDNLFEKID